jgi:hypothetical protein
VTLYVVKECLLLWPADVPEAEIIFVNQHFTAAPVFGGRAADGWSRWSRSGCLPTSAANRGSRAPTPEDEDRRRVCRERKVLIMERVQHINRIKGLLFSQGASGYEPLRRDRRARLDALQTGDGRRLP